MLTKWYPKVNAFEAQLRPYDEQLKIMEQDEQILRRNEEQAQWRCTYRMKANGYIRRERAKQLD